MLRHLVRGTSLLASVPARLSVRSPSYVFRSLSTEAPPSGAAAGSAAGAEGGAAAAADPALAALQAELADARAKLKECQESRVYLVAEMDNVRRIAKVDVDKARAYAAQPIAKGLLLAVDNLALTTSAITPEFGEGNPSVKALGEGVGATLRIFLKVLGEHGVAQFGAPGEKFNPNVHEAVAMLPAPAGQEPNTVVNVLKVGYMFKDRVLRPAQVTVAMKQGAMDEAKAAVDATAGSSRSL